MVPRPIRERCIRCFHAKQNCYCCRIQAFDPKVKFVILIQHREARKHIATGRLSHLCLKNSRLLQGYDFSHDSRVNELLADRRYFPMVLYPGPQATNLTPLTTAGRKALFPEHREPLLFVIDGTWIMARKIMQRSANLRNLPRICFDPPRLSRIRLRKQPHEHCFSTVEAIHQSIELFGDAFGFDISGRAHDHLLEVFDFMVERQISLNRNQPRFVERTGHVRPASSEPNSPGAE